MNRTLVILLLGSISLNIFSQSLSQKYNVYRDRFHKEFLIKTDNPREKANFIPIEFIADNGQIKIADETWYLGFYIGVLATEYKIKQINKDTKGAKETLLELSNILITIDRLDSVAETYFGKPASINGFFVREDYSKNPPAMSQDQVWSLYYGFRLVKKYVDDQKILKHTKEITNRILQSINPVVKEKGTKQKRKWCIVNPNLEMVQKPEDLLVTKRPFYKTASIITDTNINLKGVNNVFSSMIESVGRWKFYHRTLFRKGTHRYNTYGVVNLTVLSSPQKALKYSIKIEKIVNKYFPKGAFAHFPLTSALLYYGELPYNKEYYQEILDSAPMEGPNFKANTPWNTLSLIACPWQNDSKGRFNGLDYMLLHNLTELYFYKK